MNDDDDDDDDGGDGTDVREVDILLVNRPFPYRLHSPSRNVSSVSCAFDGFYCSLPFCFPPNRLTGSCRKSVLQ